MCDPFSASLALMAAGTTAQVAAQRKSQKAMSEAQGLEAGRQKKFRQEGEEVFSKSLNRLGAENQINEEQLAGDARGQQMAGAAEAVAPASVQQLGEAPQVVADETSARTSSASSRARQNALAQGFLGGFQDVGLSNLLQNARSNQQIGTINNMRQGSESALGYEMNRAAHVGDNLKNVGSGLTTLASLVGMYGAMQPAAAATSAATTGGTQIADALNASYGAGNASTASILGAESATSLLPSLNYAPTLQSAAGWAPAIVPGAQVLRKYQPIGR